MVSLRTDPSPSRADGPHLGWALQQASEQVESPSVGHPDDHVGDATVGCHAQHLVDKAYHALGPLTTVALHRGELGGQEVVELLGDMRHKTETQGKTGRPP